ncbi:MAG: cupin domain-containing protein [Acidobacteria bacterium]|nr:cupin domain-containing protein [Acidobacteriota bacterium]
MSKKIALLALFAAATLAARDPLADRIAHTRPETYRDLKAVHEGAGEMRFTTLVPGDAFETNLLFVHRGVLAPHGGIGHHVHSHMEEMFFILDGAAQFTINGRTSQLDGPASVPCRMSNAHAIYNHTEKPVQWMNIAVSTRKGKYDAFNLGDDRVGAPLDKIPVFISARYEGDKLKPVEGAEGVFSRRALPETVFYTDWAYVDHILVKPGAKTLPERHEGVEELYYVLRGAGAAHVNGESAAMAQDDALPVLFGDIHAFENTGSGDLQLLVIGVAKQKWKTDTSIIE